MLYGGLALLNARNAYAHTPLHVAVSHGATRAARCLIEHGANPTLRFDGFSARRAYPLPLPLPLPLTLTLTLFLPLAHLDVQHAVERGDVRLRKPRHLARGQG